MSNITLTIGGRPYTVACAPGEEDHVEGLGQLIDGKLDSLPGSVSLSETRSLLFAALLLADEVHELREAVTESAGRPAPIDPARLAVFAERLENLARHLEGAAIHA